MPDPRPSAAATREPSEVAGRPATLADVARLAGVSSATATRALHGHPRVTAATRARAAAAAASLGYVPHLGARALALRSSQTIGLLVPSTADMFWGEVAAGLEERALAEGFSVLLATSHGDAERERSMIELFLGKRADGIVIGSAAGMPAAWFPGGRPSAPIVLVDWDTPLARADVDRALEADIDDAVAAIARRGETALAHVRTRDLDGGRAAVEHLLALGHERIAFAGLAPIGPSLLRLLGVRQVLEARGLALTMAVACDGSLEGGRAAGEHIVRARPRPTAVVAFDDLVAVGVVHAAHAAGLRVPDDLSVVGFDDVQIARFVEPPLTTYAQPKGALGALAVEVILEELRGEGAAGIIALEGRLVVRRSTARPNGA